MFFDWNTTDLTPRAEAVLHDVIVAWKALPSARNGAFRVEVAGHADASLPTDAALRLSLGEANAVAAALVQSGIPSRAIDVRAYGRSRLLIPTADGVREMQNRRVSITLHK